MGLQVGGSAGQTVSFPDRQPMMLTTTPTPTRCAQYVGLWHEAEGDAARAREAITAAAATQYAQVSGDYMADLAKVHCKQRGWA